MNASDILRETKRAIEGHTLTAGKHLEAAAAFDHEAAAHRERAKHHNAEATKLHAMLAAVEPPTASQTENPAAPPTEKRVGPWEPNRFGFAWVRMHHGRTERDGIAAAADSSSGRVTWSVCGPGFGSPVAGGPAKTLDEAQAYADDSLKVNGYTLSDAAPTAKEKPVPHQTPETFGELLQRLASYGNTVPVEVIITGPADGSPVDREAAVRAFESMLRRYMRRAEQRG